MIVSGLQKLTLLDYPGKVACTVFTGGCNFRCPFCHNASLVLPQRLSHELTEEEILSFLKKRCGMLDGVAVTGGEPLLHQDIGLFLRKVRDLGYKIKLDTNGSFPDRLEALIRDGLVDRVAMDVKTALRFTPSQPVFLLLTFLPLKKAGICCSLELWKQNSGQPLSKGFIPGKVL